MRRDSSEAKVARVCEWCGVVFKVYQCHLDRDVAGKFCSRACSDKGRVKNNPRGAAHPQWKGGTDYRRRALEHYGRSCRYCGYDRELSLLWVHHKDFSRDNHDIENLEVLCIRCHLELHLERNHALQV